jgi:transposase
MLITGDCQAYVCRDVVDMRNGIDGLSYLVEPLLARQPMSGHLFVFVGRDRRKVKILYWDRTGFALWYKRLERGKFPAPESLAQRGLSVAELHAWLEGIDIPTLRPHQAVASSLVA